jgi:hypothetical protein
MVRTKIYEPKGFKMAIARRVKLGDVVKSAAIVGIENYETKAKATLDSKIDRINSKNELSTMKNLIKISEMKLEISSMELEDILAKIVEAKAELNKINEEIAKKSV